MQESYIWLPTGLLLSDSEYQERVNRSESSNVNTRVNLYRARLHVTARSVSGIFLTNRRINLLTQLD